MTKANIFFLVLLFQRVYKVISQECSAPYYLENGVCVLSCTIGYQDPVQRACLPCLVENCIECPDNRYYCEECIDGYDDEDGICEVDNDPTDDADDVDEVDNEPDNEPENNQTNDYQPIIQTSESNNTSSNDGGSSSVGIVVGVVVGVLLLALIIVFFVCRRHKKNQQQAAEEELRAVHLQKQSEFGKNQVPIVINVNNAQVLGDPAQDPAPLRQFVDNRNLDGVEIIAGGAIDQVSPEQIDRGDGEIKEGFQYAPGLEDAPSNVFIKPESNILQKDSAVLVSQNKSSVLKKGEPNLCVVCQDKRIDTIFLTCNHVCACEGCSQLIMNKNAKCPICNGPIKGSQRVYIP